MTNATESADYTCGQTACPIKISGLCLEGLTIDDCPHVKLNDFDDDNESFAEDFSAVEATVSIALFSGDELSQAQLTDVTNAYRTRLIVVLGEPNSGKTTLLASLFDLFQKGPFASFLFAGSRTQIGFEKRCHLARLASGRQTPETERTKSSDFSFLHLALRAMPLTAPAQHLLFTDVSGERFRLARDNAQEMEQLTILAQADRVFCVIDGKQLIHPTGRHVVKANLITLLNRTQQNSVLPDQKGIDLLINKWDEIVVQGKEKEVESFFNEPLRARFPLLVRSITSVCARPMATDQLAVGFGFESLLNLCVTNKKAVFLAEDTSLTRPIREFERFMNR